VSVAQTVRQIGASLVVGLGFSSLGHLFGCAEPDQCQTDDACLKNEKNRSSINSKALVDLCGAGTRILWKYNVCHDNHILLYTNTVDVGSELAYNLPIYRKTGGNNDDYNLLIRCKVKRVLGFV